MSELPFLPILKPILDALRFPVVATDSEGKMIYSNGQAQEEYKLVLPDFSEVLSTQDLIAIHNGMAIKIPEITFGQRWWTAGKFSFIQFQGYIWSAGEIVLLPEETMNPEEWKVIHHLFRHSTDNLLLINEKGRIEGLNKAAQASVPASLLSDPQASEWISWWAKEYQPQVIHCMQKAVSGHTARFQGTRQGPSGITTYWDVSLMCWHQADEGKVKLLVTSREITGLLELERKTYSDNKELQQMLAEFRFVTDFIPQMVWATDAAGYHDFYNQQWYSYTGLDYETSKAEGWNRVLHPEDQQLALEKFTHSLRTGEDYEIEYRFRRYDGEYRWFLGRAQPMRSANGTILKWFGTCTDIHDTKTEHARLESLVQERTQDIARSVSELKQQHEFAENILEASANIITVLDTDFRIRLMNRKCEEVYKIKREETIGKKYLELFPEAEGGSIHQLLLRALKGERIVQNEVTGGIIAGHFQLFMIPLFLRGTIDGVLVMTYDVTELVKASQRLKKANEELVTINADLTQFAYIASHDLQEPLRKIQTFGNLAEMKLPGESADIRMYLQKMISSAHRMSTLLSDLLKYSRMSGDKGQFQIIALDLLIKHLEQDLEIIIQERSAQIKYSDLGLMEAVPSQMNQLFSNLILNAIKFCQTQPCIEISAEEFSASPELIAQFPVLNRHELYKRIIIRDNGIGIEERYWEKVFIIFQRLNAQGEFPGTGIGLAICRKIVENHQGVIHIIPTESGTSFEIILPVKQALTGRTLQPGRNH